MYSISSLRSAPRSWINGSILAPYIEAFSARLRQGRYAAGTARSYLGSIAHLARWLSQCCLPLRQLDESAIDRFLSSHVARCDCPEPVVHDRRTLIGVRVADVVLEGAACVHLHGKGRKQRSVPLWRSTVKELRAWLKNNPPLDATSALLPNRDRQPMTRSNVTQRLALAARAAAKRNPALANRHISPHTIRHSTAMHLLQSGVDISVIALWLGHESPTTTHHYIEADLAMKERALSRLKEPKTHSRRYRAPDSLLQFLRTL